MCVGVVGVTLSPAAPLVKPLAAVLTFERGRRRAPRLPGIQPSSRSPRPSSRRCSRSASSGPAPAFLIPAISYVATWLVERYRWRALLINIAGSSTPVAPRRRSPSRPSTRRARAPAFVAAARGRRRRDDGAQLPDRAAAVRAARRAPRCARSCGRCTALVAAVAHQHRGRRRRSPRSTPSSASLALVFVLLNVVAFTYMARLVVTARERTRQYANLSWGVLSGLIRTLDERDSRAARHCAAVAAFSRDIAAPRADVQARPGVRAHRGPAARHRQVRALRPRDGARRPARGVRLARRSAATPTSAPSCCATSASTARWPRSSRAHHERIDGRGYPRGPDGRRDPGDRADRRGRRGLRHAHRARHLPHADELVRGAQRAAPRGGLPARRRSTSRRSPSCSSGRGTDYRHADEADFDRELDIERRMNEAVAASPDRRQSDARAQRVEELVELLDAEAPLAAGRAVALQVAGVRPAAHGRDRHAQVARGLRRGEAQRDPGSVVRLMARKYGSAWGAPRARVQLCAGLARASLRLGG